jgi:hypothetical protein
MGRHVKAISDERNRTEPKAADDLRDHHGRADCNDSPRLALIPLVCFAQEYVRMAKAIN